MVLAELIYEYLKSNRRLVVPQLGAFLVKEPAHKIFFSTFLKRDDGVLRELIISSGLSEVEAEALLNRLLFEIRYAIENREVYSLMGVGNFTGDESGTLVFSEWVGEPEPVEDAPVVEEKVEEELPKQEEVSIVTATIKEEQTSILTEQADKESDSSSAVEDDESTQIKLERSASSKVFQVKEHYRDEDAATEGYVKSKSERKPAKTGKRRPDIWLLIAIAVVLLAIGAIMYGFFVDSTTGGDSSDDYAAMPTTEFTLNNLG